MDLSASTAFFRGLRANEAGCSRVFQEAERLVEKLTGLKGWTGEVDRRLLDILETIQRRLSAPVRSRELARQACLSEDRFLHLFKEQLRITLRQRLHGVRAVQETAFAHHPFRTDMAGSFRKIARIVQVPKAVSAYNHRNQKGVLRDARCLTGYGRCL